MNDLLLWMSARGDGSLRALRAQAEATAGSTRSPASSIRPLMWNLAKLGHAEFDPAAGGFGWRVAPPTLAARLGVDCVIATLCGARTPALLDRIAPPVPGDVVVRQSPQSNAPDLIELQFASTATLVATAKRIGATVQWNAPVAILAACDAVRSLSFSETSFPVSGSWVVSRFAKRAQEWEPSNLDAARTYRTGLFRFKSEYGTSYFVVEAHRPYACPDAATGKFRVLTRRHRALAYDSERLELTFPAACRPPELIERALVLSSGRLPAWRDDRLIYGVVQRNAAEAAAALLGQRI